MADKKDEAKPSQPALPSGADIPDLKKKEEEKKKGGAAWGGAKGPGSPFAGATGGTARAAASAARSAVIGAGRAAAGGGFFADLFAQLSALIGRLGATLLGKAILAAIAAALIGVVAMVVGAILGAGGAEKGGAAGHSLNLGGIAATVKAPRADKGSTLAYVTAGSMAPKTEAAPATAVAPKTEAAPAATTAAPPTDDAAKAAQAGKTSKWFAPKLNASLGDRFGNKNIFSGSAFGAGAGLGAPPAGMSALGQGMADKGKLGAMGGATAAGKGGGLKSAGIKNTSKMALTSHLGGPKTNRALSQLRGMMTQTSAMRSGGTTGTESNASAATAQFENATPAAAPSGTPADTQLPPPGGGGGGSFGGGGQPGLSNTGVASTQPQGIENCTQAQIDAGLTASDCAAGGNTNTNAPPPPGNQTPWQGLITACEIMLCIGCAMTIVTNILSNYGTYATTAGTALAAVNYTAAAGAALIATGASCTSASKILGGITIGMGVLVAILGGIALSMGASGAQGGLVIAGGVALGVAAGMAMAGGGAGAIGCLISFGTFIGAMVDLLG